MLLPPSACGTVLTHTTRHPSGGQCAAWAAVSLRSVRKAFGAGPGIAACREQGAWQTTLWGPFPKHLPLQNLLKARCLLFWGSPFSTVWSESWGPLRCLLPRCPALGVSLRRAGRTCCCWCYALWTCQLLCTFYGLRVDARIFCLVL